MFGAEILPGLGEAKTGKNGQQQRTDCDTVPHALLHFTAALIGTLSPRLACASIASIFLSEGGNLLA